MFERHQIEFFIDAIEQDDVPNRFSDEAITLKVFSDEGLVEVIRKMRAEDAPFAAVMSPTGKYLGVVLASEVERKIADSVLAMQ